MDWRQLYKLMGWKTYYTWEDIRELLGPIPELQGEVDWREIAKRVMKIHNEKILRDTYWS